MESFVTVNREDLHTVLFHLMRHSNGFRAHDTAERDAAERLLEAVYGNTTVEPAKPMVVTPVDEPTFEPAGATTTVKRVDATVKRKTSKRKQ